MEPFDLLGPLPTGTTVLEASAGTGKTYALAGLVTRYVAEGARTLDEMLLITFGRAASQELRERVRDQLAGRRARSGATRDRWRDDPGCSATSSTASDAERRRTAQPAAGRAGRLRRGHHRDDPPVLPAGTALARRRRRHRRRRHPGRRPRTSWSPRSSTTSTSSASAAPRSARPSPAPPRSSSPPRWSATRTPAGPEEYAERSPEGVRVDVRDGRAGRARAPQAAARHPRLRRPADPAGRRAGGPRRPGPRSGCSRRWSVVMVDEFQDTDPVQWKVIEPPSTGTARWS